MNPSPEHDTAGRRRARRRNIQAVGEPAAARNREIQARISPPQRFRHSSLPSSDGETQYHLGGYLPSNHANTKSYQWVYKEAIIRNVIILSQHHISLLSPNNYLLYLCSSVQTISYIFCTSYELTVGVLVHFFKFY